MYQYKNMKLKAHEQKKKHQPLTPSRINLLAEELRKDQKSITDIADELGISYKWMQFAIIYASGQYDYSPKNIYKAINPEVSDDTATSNGYKVIHNPRVRALMNIIYIVHGLNDTAVDVELVKVIKQNDNMIAKTQALRLYYEMTGRISRDVKVTVEQKKVDLSKFTDDELRQYLTLTTKANPRELGYRQSDEPVPGGDM
jgi:hypothetical protein